MRVRLSTALLLFTVIALSIAWYGERRYREQNFEKQLSNCYVGASRFQSAFDEVYMAKALRDPEATLELVHEYTDHRLFGAMETLWRFEREIEFVQEDDSHSSLALAKMILIMLDCDKPADFFEFANGLFPPGDEESSGLFFEIRDTDSTQHKLFKTFIERALEFDLGVPWSAK